LFIFSGLGWIADVQTKGAMALLSRWMN